LLDINLYVISTLCFCRNLAVRNMSTPGNTLNEQLSQKTDVFGLKLWVLIGIAVGVLISCVLAILVLCLTLRSRRRLSSPSHLPITQIPPVSKEIKEVRVESANKFVPRDGILLTVHDKSNNKDSDKVMVHVGLGKSRHTDDNSHSSSFHCTERNGSAKSEEGSSGTGTVHRQSASYHITAPSPLTGLPEFSHLGWGHWFTLRDLELATNHFSKENVIGEGGYGVVYRGHLVNGTPVAIKKLLNNL